MSSPRVLIADAASLDDLLLEECFGPVVVVAIYTSPTDLLAALARVEGSLTATIHCGSGDDDLARTVAADVAGRAGRVLFNGYPTGVAVSWAMQHGGPWPATTASLHTSVGATAIRRFLRPITYQDAPASLLPPELREDNPLRLPRRVDGAYELAG